jgi:uncharacterized membrane protein
MIGGVRLRQWYADLLATFWLRPAAMTVLAIVAAQGLVWSEGAFELPDLMSRWVYSGGKDGARDVLAAIATASIGVAGTTFSITVAALTLASNQMGPRLLRNFTRDPGNQYALGTFLATFAYALTALRTVRGLDGGNDFVPQLAVSGALLLAFACVGVLMWFLNHVASSINVTHVVALVHDELAAVVARLPFRTPDEADAPGPAPLPHAEVTFRDSAPLRTKEGGYLRALDDGRLAEWAAGCGAVVRLRVRPGDFVFPGSTIGEVVPPAVCEAAHEALAGALSLGRSRSVEQDLEFAVRQMVEIALRALSPSLNDPFTAIAVIDRFGAVLCDLEHRNLPNGCTARSEQVRVQRPATDYAGLADAMFHMIRESGVTSPPVMIRLLEVLAEVGAVEHDAGRRKVLRRHAELAAEAALNTITDRAAREDIAARRVLVLETLAAEVAAPGISSHHPRID